MCNGKFGQSYRAKGTVSVAAWADDDYFAPATGHTAPHSHLRVLGQVVEELREVHRRLLRQGLLETPDVHAEVYVEGEAAHLSRKPHYSSSLALLFDLVLLFFARRRRSEI